MICKPCAYAADTKTDHSMCDQFDKGHKTWCDCGHKLIELVEGDNNAAWPIEQRVETEGSSR